jgi:hypothetical protein
MHLGMLHVFSASFQGQLCGNVSVFAMLSIIFIVTSSAMWSATFYSVWLTASSYQIEVLHDYLDRTVIGFEFVVV